MINLYLVSNSNCKILFDTSTTDKRKKILKRLNKININNIDLLAISHTHYDHVQNADWLRDKFDLKVIVNNSEKLYLEKGDSKLPKGTIWFTKILVSAVKNRKIKPLMFQMCDVDLSYNEKFDFSEFGIDAYLLHTPGHSEGMSSMIIDNEIALVGDAMFRIFPWSIFPPFADDLRTLHRMWKKLLDTGAKLFLPGHGTEISRKLLTEKYNKGF